MNFKEKLKELLENANMTQAELAHKINYSASTLNYHMTHNNTHPNEELKEAIAKALNISPATFSEKSIHYLHIVKNIIKTIRACCNDKNIMPSKLKDEINITIPTVDEIFETRNALIDKINIWKIAKRLNINITHFFDPSNDREPNNKYKDKEILQLPILGNFPGTFEIEESDTNIEFIEVPKSYVLTQHQYQHSWDNIKNLHDIYAIKISDNNKKLLNRLGFIAGDYVIIEEGPHDISKNDTIIIMDTSDSSIIIKRLEYKKNKIVFYPPNDKDEGINLIPEQIDGFENLKDTLKNRYYSDSQQIKKENNNKMPFKFIGRVLCLIRLYNKPLQE